MTSIPVQIVMTADDFSRLLLGPQDWGGNPTWKPQIQNGRFELDGVPYVHPSTDWKFVYGAGNHYAAVILAKSFLASQGFPCQAATDREHGGDSRWVILTDYIQPGLAS